MERSTINPNSRFVRWWDVIIVTSLFYTAFVTPFEVSFLAEEGPINFTINRTVDVIFALDMIVTFFMPFRASSKKGGMWVYDNGKIAKAYVKGWFFLDLITTFPISTVVRFSVEADDSNEGTLAILRAMRVMRVIKLARILRASRIFNRWQDHIGLSYAHFSLIRFLILVLVLAHWLACIWGYIGSTRESYDDIEYDGYDYAYTWRDKARVHSQSAFDVYVVSLYVSLNNIFGGSCEINPSNYLEFSVQCLMLILGSSTWAYVTASACGSMRKDGIKRVARPLYTPSLT